VPGPSRRTVLMGGIGLLVAGCGAGYELIQDGTLPGKYALARLDGACGSAPPPPRGALPAAAGLETSRIALLGESVGGYGALLLAERLAAAGRRGMPAVAAVAALSPAIFASYADAIAANRGAFDSPADFRRNDVPAGAAALRDVTTWIACGSDDPFEAEAGDLRARLAALTGRPVPGGILAGCHDDAFWQRNMPAALGFAGAHLSGRAAR
jgi:hypothetical protein